MDNQKRHSPTYYMYQSLDLHSKVKFYNEEIKNQPSLDYYEHLELRIDYTITVFEIGKYEKYLYLVDDVIEIVMEENIFHINGEDAFQTLLFKKAAAHFNLNEYENAIIILEQLKRINPKEQLYKFLLNQAIKKENLSRKKHVLRPITIFLLLTSLFLIIIDIFIIDAFYYQYHESTLILASTVALMGISVFAIEYSMYLFKKYR